jgi:hypothetical protein
LGGELKGKEQRRAQGYIPHQILKRKALKSLQEECQEKAPKITKKENREKLKQALRNRAESSIHTMKIRTRSRFCPIILPSTRSQHQALKVVLEIPRERKKKIAKQNELGFQEMAAILSPLGLYGGNRKAKIPLLAN